MSAAELPHGKRLRGLIEALDAPVVQLWGWPGTGKRALLRSFLAAGHAVFVPRARLAAEDARLSARDDLDDSVRWLVVEGPDPAQLQVAASLLRPHQRLLFAAHRRLGCNGLAVATSPQDLLLTAGEVKALWSRAGVARLSDDEARELQLRSDGWLLPLRLWSRVPDTAAEPAWKGGELPVAPVESFFRSRVLGGLRQREREILFEIARRGSLSWESMVDGGGRREERRRSLSSLAHSWGLVRIDGGVPRVPRSLGAFLEKEASRWGRLGSVSRSRGGSYRVSRRTEESEPDVSIRLLGAPRVMRRGDDGELQLVRWSFKRPLKVLAYLASAPDLQASKEEIIGILWAEASEGAVSRNLHPTMSRLRRTLHPEAEPGAVVRLHDGVYRLDPCLRWQVDVRLFLDRIEEGARALENGSEADAGALWEEAWRLYDGEFLEGFSDRWVLAQRDEIQMYYLELLQRLGDLYRGLGRWTEAEDAYRTLLLEDPLNETVHAAMMRVYAARGRRDLVNRQFQRLREILLEELGVEPSSRTLDAYNELLVH